MEELKNIITDAATLDKVLPLVERAITEAAAAATRTKAESFEAVFTGFGYKKPEGVPGTQFAADTLKSLNEQAKQAAALAAKVAEYEKQAPQFEQLRQKFEQDTATIKSELERKNAEVAQIKFDAKFENIAAKIQFDPALSDAGKSVLEAKKYQILQEYTIIESGNAVVLAKNGVPQFDANGLPLTLESVVLQAAKPFLAKTPQQPPKQTEGGQTFANPDEIATFAKANNINLSTKEGYAKMQKLLAEKK